MDQYSIQTTQNVEIQFQVASVGDRIISTLIDWGVFLLYYIFIALVTLGVVTIGNGSPVVMLVLFTPLIFYSLLCEWFLNGQSFGKRAMRIRVVRLDGNQLSFGNCFVRWVFRLVDFQFTGGLCAILTVIIGGKGQRLGDLAAGTTVLKIDAKGGIEETGFMELPQDYVPKYPEVDRLNDSDIRTIKEVLFVVRESGYSVDMNSFLMKTNDLVCEKMGVKHDLAPYKFLQTVLYDFNYYHR